MNLQLDIKASSLPVRIMAGVLSQAGGWTFATYDSDEPESETNRPYSEHIEMANMFGSPVHAVTFFNENDVAETVNAGLLLVYPQIAWTELAKKLGTPVDARYPLAPVAIEAPKPKAPPAPEKFLGPVTSLFSGVSPYTGTK